MPKCQFLFSAVFGFRNPSKEIFSESDEINTQFPIFTGSFKNIRESAELSGPTRAPPRLPFHLYKLPDLKPRYEYATVRKTFQSHRHREGKIWGTGVSVPARHR